MADTSPNPDSSHTQRSIAATVDIGLAGLLSSVLAHHRDEPSVPATHDDDLESLFDLDDEVAAEPVLAEPVLAEKPSEFRPELEAEKGTEVETHADSDLDLFDLGDATDPGDANDPDEIPEVAQLAEPAEQVPPAEMVTPAIATEVVAPPTKRIKGRFGPAGGSKAAPESALESAPESAADQNLQTSFAEQSIAPETVEPAITWENPYVDAADVEPQHLAQHEHIAAHPEPITAQVAAEALDAQSLPAQQFDAHNFAEHSAQQPAAQQPAAQQPAAQQPAAQQPAAQQPAQQFDSNPFYDPGVQVPVAAPTPVFAEPEFVPGPKRLLTSLQIGLLLEGLSQLRARPGEDGLPPGMLLMDVRGPLGRYHNDNLYSIRAQIDAAVRGGDMALVAPDIGIVLFCGGLFFPGDLEVMGARLRRRALDANPSVSAADELRIVVAGALSVPGENPTDFIHRGVGAFDRSIETNRQDIVIDYVDQRAYRY
jgi:hypothetical protein